MGKTTETKLTIGMDRRAKFSEADRKAQFDAAMKVRGLFEEESALMDRILFLRGAARQDRRCLVGVRSAKEERDRL